VPVPWAAGLGPAVVGHADPIDTVLSAEPASAEAPDGLGVPEAAVAGPLARPARPGSRLC
jgi:hypothetical protein